MTGPKDKDLDWFTARLKECFEIKAMDEDKPYLGMEVMKKPNSDITISQHQYIEQILEDFGMEDCNTTKTPMPAVRV